MKRSSLSSALVTVSSRVTRPVTLNPAWAVDEVFVRAASDQLGRLMVVEEASSRGLPVREVLEEQRRWQEENWAAEAMQRIFRAYKRLVCGVVIDK